MTEIELKPCHKCGSWENIERVNPWINKFICQEDRRKNIERNSSRVSKILPPVNESWLQRAKASQKRIEEKYL